MKRTAQIIGGVIGVVVVILLAVEIWFRTQSVLFLISMTCLFPFAVVYIVTGRVLKRRYPLVAVVILALVGGWGLLIAWGNQFNPPGQAFSPVESGFIMNLSTEVVGAAIVLFLLSFSRNLGNVVLFFLALGVVLLVEQTTGPTQDITLNLSTELLGSLLTAMMIWRFKGQFE